MKESFKKIFKLSSMVKTTLILGFFAGSIQSFYTISQNEYLKYSLYNLSLYSAQEMIDLWILKMVLVAFILHLLMFLILNRWKVSSILLISLLTYIAIIFSDLNSKIDIGATEKYGLLISVFLGWLSYRILVYVIEKKIWFSNPVFWKNLTFKLSIGVAFGILFLNCIAFLNKWYNKPLGPNIIIVLIDTLRKDHLSSYGYWRNTSPTIDSFAKDGILFKNFFAQSPSTKPSTASLFTSKYPSQHNVIYNKDALASSFVTIAEVLKEKGYKTIGFNSNYVINSNFNFNQGFDEWIEFGSKEVKKIKAKKITAQLIPWVEKNYDNPFFLYIHYLDPHSPYQAPEPYKNFFDRTYRGNVTGSHKDLRNPKFFQKYQNELKHLISLYDNEIRYVDSEIKKLFDKLKELNILDESIIILTSDHGEGFLEHGRFFHSYSIYSELINVPLIIRYPKLFKPGQLSNIYTQHIDIFPFLLEALGVESSRYNFEGTPLIFNITKMDPDITQKTPEVLSEHLRKNNNAQKSLIYKDWKLIKDINSNRFRLYNIKSDSKDFYDLIHKERQIALELNNKLTQLEERLKKTKVLSPKVRLNKQLKEQLKALGYIN